MPVKPYPAHLEDAFVKHAVHGREAIVTDGPMFDAAGQRWICRVRFVDNEQEAWEFADDLDLFEKKPTRE